MQYTALTGKPWLHRSWYNVPESLDPRMGVSAAPAMTVLRRLVGSAATMTGTRTRVVCGAPGWGGLGVGRGQVWDSCRIAHLPCLVAGESPRESTCSARL